MNMASGGDGHSSTPELDQGQVNSESDHMDSEDSKEREEPPAVPDPVEKSVMILERAKSDTEKFAALLMVTKLTKAGKLSETEKKKIMNAVGLPFLARLMRTSDVPEGCPPFMFKSIALTVLTSLMSCCSGSQVLYGLIPILCEIISKSELYETDLTLIKDSYQCLKYIASDQCGSEAIIDYEALAALVEAYAEGNFGCNDAIDIILMVASEEGTKTWEDEPEAFMKLMTHIAHEFVVDHEENKFKLCNVLTKLLQSMPPSSEMEQQGWKQDLHKGISDIIFSKLGREHRISGLRLAGTALENLGLLWLLRAGAESSTEETKGKQLLLMMVHLSCIEVRMGLEDRTFEEVVSNALPITACYTIIEMSVVFLVNGAVDFEQKHKQQLYESLKGAINAVLKFLQGASFEDAVLESSKTYMFVCATIRVLCAWLAEETAANKDDVYKTLPFVIKICKHSFDHNKTSVSKSKKKGHSVVTHKAEDKKKLPDVLKFLLPGLCHLTAEDIPRRILIDLELENLLFEYFSFHWNSIKDAFGPQVKEEVDIPVHKIHAAGEAMSTISNIFMNIVVQEPERVKSDILYYSLMKFIFCKLPEIPLESCHLKLSGTLCILGLMILRHQHPNVKSTDFTIFRFVQSTVRFLWDSHNVEESRDYATLVVSSKYESDWGSLMDIWFLGMHTLSFLLPIIPWLSDFLMESEWPQTIVATLLTVREGGLDVGLKSALEDFLSLLCRSSNTANNVLQEKGVLQVCKNHKLEELSHVFGVKL
ncbi:neurochondrin homolog isoform X2 [Portunus trituberculatus]|uniref:Neurochondrin n=2 Tax=Portunus trituberculatus TaxID=210409 RepID=A0A5B7DUG6_PORTR|nr:neurochondrin homolog isoform X2 [Portunus trituberculatus]XP_045110191.1 neurochondrin homolog isoform X2 [Portunus trituberculatus]MPC25098.1 Neurochondrin [Portunus trituberculatus]